MPPLGGAHLAGNRVGTSCSHRLQGRLVSYWFLSKPSIWTSEGAGIAKDGVALTATTPEHPSLGLVACCPSLGKVSSIFLYSASIHFSFSTCTQRGPRLPLSTWMGQSLSPQSSSPTLRAPAFVFPWQPFNPRRRSQRVLLGFCIPSPPQVLAQSRCMQDAAGTSTGGKKPCCRPQNLDELPLCPAEPGSGL